MRALIINEVCGHTSTGKICTNLAMVLEKDGYEVKIAYGRDAYVPSEYLKYAIRIGNDFSVILAAIETRLFDNHGLANRSSTLSFIRWANQYDPDFLWIHNLHGYYINYELLFSWIKTRPQMQVKWTLHDCWAITGHCTYFSYVKCDRWKEECRKCKQKRSYPQSLLVDGSRKNYLRKKKAFCGVQNLKIITPSNWLKEMVENSILKEYPIEVINNEVDNTIFKYRDSNFRDKYNLGGKKVILGVANVWEKRKGLNVFLELSSLLSKEYKIVLVGLNKKQINSLPKDILGLPRTNNQIELAEIYSAADLFLNPSVEETFGMTTVEAELCGTKAIVYKDTACEEIAMMYDTIVVPQGDLNSLLDAIKKNC